MPTNTSGWEVIISMKPGIPAAELATLAAAEARVAAESGKGAPSARRRSAGLTRIR
jgi:hypothetical protein